MHTVGGHQCQSGTPNGGGAVDEKAGQGGGRSLSRPGAQQSGPEGEEVSRTGDTRVAKLSTSYSVWVGGDGAHVDADLWAEAWNLEFKFQPPIAKLSAGGQLYWAKRQDGAYQKWEGTLAACDGSAGKGMGAAAVLRTPTGELESAVCKVGGPASSFRAEAAAMWQAIFYADKSAPLAVLTDSMNVIQALQAWDRADFAREMEWQKNADILQAILLAINERVGPITIAKVKSHRGVDLNERADLLAGMAVGEEEEETATLFTPAPPDSTMKYSWKPTDAEEEVCTDDHRVVHKHWEETCRARCQEKVRREGTYAGQMLLHPGWGQ